jgi:altronate dehydratase
VKAALVISDRDNVATALETLTPGRRLDLPGGTLTVVSQIPRGHKIAVREIRAGQAVVKYGSPIGTATADIPAGTHVHTHNVASDRGRGDRAARPGVNPDAGAGAPEDSRDHPRIAEPPDEAVQPPGTRP